MDQYMAVLVAELAASFINFFNYCSPYSGCYGAGKITEALTICLDPTPSGLSVPPPQSPPIFTPNTLSAATLPIYPGLGQAPKIMLPCIPGDLV